MHFTCRANVLLALSAFAVATQGPGGAEHSPTRSRITEAAAADHIDLTVLPFISTAFASIEAIQSPVVAANNTINASATRVDTHVHLVPDWYRALVPVTGGNPTPEWDVQSHLQFMADNSIRHSFASVSSPGSGAYPGDETKSVALARVLNEWSAALVKTYPDRFSFFAVVPLPYVQAAITEVDYALSYLGAAGVICLTNHEGFYLGNPMFTPFFNFLNSRNSSREVIFVHPNEPHVHQNHTLTSANPTLYPPGAIEFYFETARTFMDLTVSQTLASFTKLATPSRTSAAPFRPAGPTYNHQVQGLLAHSVPASQLIFGSDWPYGPPLSSLDSLAAIVDAPVLSPEEKEGVFGGNAGVLFGA
ncbi:hypothetical protein B0A49_07865 [Cryomyces minteri]|uniref:Amidohydrolase-related domain-containing protein n=1 Tax=Cryomyces minteri TaxID=331657 RepID=A0A4U0WHJ6_9PEZI|nr:hypothetical protein B0A49_08374 [Cryomyces minteri]TKA63795.1 hypothetical protein B0A49_07865 [Cryomyces minteri]